MWKWKVKCNFISSQTSLQTEKMFSLAERGFFSPLYRCNSCFYFIKHILTHSKFKRSWTIRFLHSFVKSSSNRFFRAVWHKKSMEGKKLPHSPAQRGSGGPSECKMPHLLPSPQPLSHSADQILQGWCCSQSYLYYSNAAMSAAKPLSWSETEEGLVPNVFYLTTPTSQVLSALECKWRINHFNSNLLN